VRSAQERSGAQLLAWPSRLTEPTENHCQPAEPACGRAQHPVNQFSVEPGQARPVSVSGTRRLAGRQHPLVSSCVCARALRVGFKLALVARQSCARCLVELLRGRKSVSPNCNNTITTITSSSSSSNNNNNNNERKTAAEDVCCPKPFTLVGRHETTAATTRHSAHFLN
jgi:hypothetical protein